MRRLAEHAGVNVASLKRVRIGAFKMPYSLKVGRYQELSPQEAKAVLADAAAGDPRAKQPRRRPPPGGGGGAGGSKDAAGNSS